MKRKTTMQVIVWLLTMLLICTGLTGCQSWYITTNLADYGVISGNGTDRMAQELFDQLFPAKIEDYFEDVRYSYRAYNLDSWDFEIYLEFTIEDSDLFHAYVQSIASEEQFTPFEYDNEFLEYVIEDYYLFVTSGRDGICEGCRDKPIHNHIEEAKIAKVLVHPAEQRVICVALGVFDGGGARSSDFTCYFDRFGIDPIEYEMSHSKLTR